MGDWWLQLQSVGIVALAGALGGLIGLEREIAHKPAGVRTHVLVAAASALLMLLGEMTIRVFDDSLGAGRVVADPIRTIQAIVVGISFLGAGTIFRHGGERVEGLTTAASILFTSGVGIAVGLRQYLFAVGLTVISFVVLFVVARLVGLFRSSAPEKQ